MYRHRLKSWCFSIACQPSGIFALRAARACPRARPSGVGER